MKFKYLYRAFLFTAIALIASASVCSASIKAYYLYNLASFNGVLPYSGVTMFLDRSRNEAYICNGSTVDIFSPSGMEIYSFGDDARLGSAEAGAVFENGDILLLTNNYKNGRVASDLVLCNYRGEPISDLTLRGIPPEFGKFNPERMVYRSGRLYLADFSSMKVLVADRTGKYLDGYNIASILKLSDKQVRDSGITGFNVDKDGNIFFTIAVKFRAFKITPDRKVSSWGEPGGPEGKFNVVSGIATDDKGNIYVVDSLKSAVLVFDKDFRFLLQFSGRGRGPGDLIAPRSIAIDDEGKVYVNQAADRGVNVYKIID
jgi:6-bladed beta-propeller